jgi:FkbM family methyltransferase
MSDSFEGKEKKAIQKIAHPAIGEIYCLNEAEARVTLHEICTDKLYFQEGISILPGDIVFDVGANIGVFTLYAAKQGAHIYAYEPIPPTFEVLQQNIHLHGFDNIAQARNIGLSDRAEEKLMFHYPEWSVCDSWTVPDDWVEFMTENWENTLDLFQRASPVRAPDNAGAIPYRPHPNSDDYLLRPFRAGRVYCNATQAKAWARFPRPFGPKAAPQSDRGESSQKKQQLEPV